MEPVLNTLRIWLHLSRLGVIPIFGCRDIPGANLNLANGVSLPTKKFRTRKNSRKIVMKLMKKLADSSMIPIKAAWRKLKLAIAPTFAITRLCDFDCPVNLIGDN